jgi:hypothetical protein
LKLRIADREHIDLRNDDDSSSSSSSEDDADEDEEEAEPVEEKTPEQLRDERYSLALLHWINAKRRAKKVKFTSHAPKHKRRG